MPPFVARALDTVLDRAIAPGYTRLGLLARRHLSTWPADPAPGALDGRTAAVTGASSGLGTATAEGLARLGAHVRLVVRDPEKGERVAEKIRAAVPSARLSVDRCDLGDLDDVRRCATEMSAALGADALDVLVHNAGVMPAHRTTSPQGHELSMAVHVLGPVLLTELLRPRLAASGVHGGRVVFVTSGGMYAQRLRADDLEYTAGSYSPTSAYARSKRAQVELLAPLAERWGHDVAMVVATHPGWADTPGVVESLPGFHKLTRRALRSAEEGADTVVWLSVVDLPPARTGLFHDRRARPTSLVPLTRPRAGDVTTLDAWVRSCLDLTG